MERVSADHLTAIVADDHELLRSGLGAILRREFGFTEVIETGSIDAATEFLKERPRIRLATIELAMTGCFGASTLAALRQRFPQTLIVVLAASESRQDILTCLSAGVHGYVPKSLGNRQVTSALRRVLDGEIFVPTDLAQVPESVRPPPNNNQNGSDVPLACLTPRQRAVLDCISEGKSNKEIARSLSLTESTVKVHVHALFRALDVNNRTSAAAALMRYDRRARFGQPDAPAATKSDVTLDCYRY